MTIQSPSAARRFAPIVTGVMLVLGAARPATGQPPSASASCSRPPVTCPSPSSSSHWVSINLVPDGSGGCRFDPRTIDDLILQMGDDVDWDFCNACDADMTVQMDTTGSGPFESFDLFFPPPQADNLVTITVPCQGYGNASGRKATSSGDWKYSLRARPTSNPTNFPDVIDPKLEIDDDHGLNAWLIRGGLLLAGGLIGAFLARRRRVA